MVRLNEATTSFAADIIGNVRQALHIPLNAEVERRTARNTREVLVEIARSRAGADDSVLLNEQVAELAKHQLTQKVGEALIAALADALRSPSEKQADTLARWTQAYVAFVVMGLDSTLNAFQASRFGKKTFILDTDIVLEALVADGPRSPGSG